MHNLFKNSTGIFYIEHGNQREDGIGSSQQQQHLRRNSALASPADNGGAQSDNKNKALKGDPVLRPSQSLCSLRGESVERERRLRQPFTFNTKTY